MLTLPYQNKAAIAPMAGATDSAFRSLCRAHGAAWCVSEMVSAKALTLGDKKTAALMAFLAEERPIGIQLFGHEPKVMAEAARIVERNIAPDFIDINMGCPAPKITGSGAGSSLMRDEDLAQRIMAAVAEAVSLSATVKIRAGWETSTAASIAPKLERAGAQLITVHGRTRERMYKPPVDLDVIRAVKQSVSVPVIGNGDIYTPEQALAMQAYTGCDGVMIGRGALGNPFLFDAVNAALEGRPAPTPPTAAQRMQALTEQVQAMCVYKGEFIAAREARKHAAWYTKGFRGAARIRKEANEISSLADLERFVALVISENS